MRRVGRKDRVRRFLLKLIPAFFSSVHSKRINQLAGVFHLQQISGNFGGNFHRVTNVFHLTQVRSPPSDCDFTRQNLKMWP